MAALVVPRGRTVALAGLDRRSRAANPRTDALLLAHVALSSRSLRLVSVPRDLLVELPGAGFHRINEAVVRGGPALLAGAVRGTFGVELDGLVAVDFAAFERLVDELGGLEVVIPRPLDDPLGDEGIGLRSARFDPGRHVLSGADALAYARSRRLDGDAARRRRHLDLIGALVTRVLEIRSVRQVVRVARLARRTVVTDMGVARTVLIAAALAAVDRTRIRMASIEYPLVTPRRMDDGREIVEGDPVELGLFVRAGLGLPIGPPR
jgi:LCP family protein required for cell wall assembly